MNRKLLSSKIKCPNGCKYCFADFKGYFNKTRIGIEEEMDIDSKFKDMEFQCKRYFDLCEDNKKVISNHIRQNVKAKYSYYEKDDKELIDSIIDSLNKKQ